MQRMSGCGRVSTDMQPCIVRLDRAGGREHENRQRLGMRPSTLIHHLETFRQIDTVCIQGNTGMLWNRYHNGPGVSSQAKGCEKCFLSSKFLGW